MSLYDDIEARTERVPGWNSSNMKLLQSQMKLRKAATTGQHRRDISRRPNVLAPVIDLKGKREDEEPSSAIPAAISYPTIIPRMGPRLGLDAPGQLISFGPEYEINNEYNPVRPNEYDKVVRDMRRRKEQDRDRERREKEKETQQRALVGNYSDDETEEEEKKRNSAAGAAIAPPSFLQESTDAAPTPPAGRGAGSSLGSSIAAKIMAKYGYKEGQGLGKAGQGISRALEVEKTSKRGGRIIHERDLPGPGGAPTPPPGDTSSLMPPPPPPVPAAAAPAAEPTMAEILRNPTKVVLLRNMVGGGEVDDELEGEVKEECNTKYGEVVKVIIYEVPGAGDVDAVRIFVEFRRIENAIKAVVDLNGRFFGGRQVKARFYNQERYLDLELNEPMN